jgi:predicted ATP-dependent serine protease
MAYFCKECTYRGKVSGQVGECPACGSFNITMLAGQEEEEIKLKPWRLKLLWVLWGTLFAVIIWKVIN